MWFAKSPLEVLRELQVEPTAGLSVAEAAERLVRHGKNKLKGKPKKSLFSLFFAQLQDMLIYVLLGAAVITLKLVSDTGGEALASTAWSVPC